MAMPTPEEYIPKVTPEMIEAAAQELLSDPLLELEGLSNSAWAKKVSGKLLRRGLEARFYKT